MKLKIKFLNSNQTTEVDVPFNGAEQYVDIAWMEAQETGGQPSDINRQSFCCKLSVSKRGKLEITY